MPLKLFLRDIAGDLARGWSVTLRKYSTLLNIANIVWSGSAIMAHQFGFLPDWSLLPVLCLCIGFLAASTIASNMTQKSVGTYDKRTHRLVEILRREAGDE